MFSRCSYVFLHVDTIMFISFFSCFFLSPAVHTTTYQVVTSFPHMIDVINLIISIFHMACVWPRFHVQEPRLPCSPTCRRSGSVVRSFHATASRPSAGGRWGLESWCLLGILGILGIEWWPICKPFVSACVGNMYNWGLSTYDWVIIGLLSLLEVLEHGMQIPHLMCFGSETQEFNQQCYSNRKGLGCHEDLCWSDHPWIMMI